MIDGPTVIKSLQEVGLTILFIMVGTAVMELILYLILYRWLNYRFALPFMLIAPAIIGLIALVVYPLLGTLDLLYQHEFETFSRSRIYWIKELY